MSVLARPLRLLRQVACFFEQFFDLLHYYNEAEELLRLRRGWAKSGRCPRSIALFYIFIATVCVRLCVFPLSYLFSAHLDTTTKLVLGNFIYLFDLNDSFNLVVLALGLPVPLYYLLLYPYIGNNNNNSHHHRTLLLPAERLRQQLALSPRERDPSFQRCYTCLRLVILAFLVLEILGIIIFNIMLMMFALEHADYFFGSWLGAVRFVACELSMAHIYVSALVVSRVYIDMFVVIYYFSVHIFHQLQQSEALLLLSGRRAFRLSDLALFRRRHTVLVARVLAANSILGNVLLLYYSTNYPTNAYLLIYVFVRREVSLVVRVFVGAYMAHQFTLIIAVHLLAASYRFVAMSVFSSLGPRRTKTEFDGNPLARFLKVSSTLFHFLVTFSSNFSIPFPRNF